MEIRNSANKSIYLELKEKAVEMRKNPTEAEKIFWNAVSGRKIGLKLRRQHIIEQFIVDFYCFEKKIIIEIDGKIHEMQKEKDIERESILKSLGYKILRFTNEEVMQDIDGVVKKIMSEAPNPPKGG